jgi:hypothetical protein
MSNFDDASPLAQKAFMRAPAGEHLQVAQDFCELINPGIRAQHVPVRPAVDAVELECFWNVRREVERGHGRIAYGWAIWIWPGISIEAHHHAVLDGDEGLIDVTPWTPPCDQILFLPQPNLPYDFEERSRVSHVRAALSRTPLVREWLGAADTIDQILEHHSEGDRHVMPERVFMEVQRLGRMKDAMRLAIAKTQVSQASRNGPCPCGSGRKTKHCCLPAVR